MPQAHCWYSATQAKTWGYCYYKLTSGEVVKVSNAMDTKRNKEEAASFNFADSVYLGEGDWFADGEETRASLSFLENMDRVGAFLEDVGLDEVTVAACRARSGLISLEQIERDANRSKIEQN